MQPPSPWCRLWGRRNDSDPAGHHGPVVGIQQLPHNGLAEMSALTAKGRSAYYNHDKTGLVAEADLEDERAPAMLQPSVAPVATPLGRVATELCRFCFQVLRAHLQRLPLPPFPSSADSSLKAPLFVTWLKRRGADRGERYLERDLELRGCIGCLEPILFCSGLSEYVLRSSMQDKRFPPVRLEEVPSLTCRLSILHQFEHCLDVYDWQVGVHGVLINFADSAGRQFTATYLPEVAREHGMTKEVAIRELVTKAGYTGPCNKELLASIKVTRYQTHVESLTYLEMASAERF